MPHEAGPTHPALTIGELSARSGVAPSALHFYERNGLITSQRTSGNQRRYGSKACRLHNPSDELGVGGTGPRRWEHGG